MAGAGHRSYGAPVEAARPAVVLVEPQLGENIGAAARAMLNFGLDELRLVRPRDGWPNAAAKANAAGANVVLERAVLFDTLEAAVADRRRVLAATARPRDMAVRVVEPAAAAALLRQAAARSEPAAVVFGRESTGLDNDAIALADAAITVPSNPDFSSLNLAMAVLLIGYEWYGSHAPGPPVPVSAVDRAATREELLGFFEHLEHELDACGFFRVAEKRPVTVRNLRALFQRADLGEREVRMLRGVIGGLGRHGRSRS